jgi:hypothetical protein
MKTKLSTKDYWDMMNKKAEVRIAKNGAWSKTKKGREANQRLLKGDYYNPLEINEFHIYMNIKEASSLEHYLGIDRLARAVAKGIGEDLPILIKKLQQYECK